MMKTAVPRLICLLTLILTTCANSAVVTLRAGDDIQAAVDAAPEGALFILEPGIYRQQRFDPKERQQFIGHRGVILSGATLLTGWQNQGDYWIEYSLPAPLQPRGYCRDGGDLCKYREDLFIDGRLYQRVATLEDLGPGKWFYLDGAAYLVDDPSGHLAELSVTPRAVGGDAADVVLRNLIVEKYASAAQAGAIDARDSHGWQVIDVTARWNHGIGIYIGDGMLVRGGSYSHNGQMGMGGKGDGALIENVEIGFNNYAAYSSGWEAGGAKFVYSTGLTVRNSCVHHNMGPGLWTDIDNIDIIIEGNKVFANSGDGIKHEISYGAIIRNNTVSRNGSGKDNWLWGSQILIQNSSNVKVYGNTVEVGAEFGNAISIIHQNRGAGEHGPWIATHNAIHYNRIIYLGKSGQSGMVTDFEHASYWSDNNNNFDWNLYVVVDADRNFWTLHDQFQTWQYIRANGFEENGTLEIEQRAAMELSCEF